MESKKIANHDTTYCTNKECNLCWRHESNYTFQEGLYSFMSSCENYVKKGVKDE